MSFTFQISHPQKGVSQYPKDKAECSVEKSLILCWHLIPGNSGHGQITFLTELLQVIYSVVTYVSLFISDKSHTVASYPQEVCRTPSSDVTSVSHAMWYCQHIPTVDIQGAATQVLTGLWTLQFHPFICGVRAPLGPGQPQKTPPYFCVLCSSSPSCIPRICGVSLWTTSCHLVLGFPTGLYYEISH